MHVSSCRLKPIMLLACGIIWNLYHSRFQSYGTEGENLDPQSSVSAVCPLWLGSSEVNVDLHAGRERPAISQINKDFCNVDIGRASLSARGAARGPDDRRNCGNLAGDFTTGKSSSPHSDWLASSDLPEVAVVQLHADAQGRDVSENH